MNRSFALKLTAAVCVVALLACGLAILFKTFHIGLHYADAEKYAAGGATIDGAVKRLDIHWIDGAVNVAYHDRDAIELSETAKKALSEKERLRWWLDGDTLRVQYAQSGYFSFRGLDKALTLTLPEGIELEDVDIDVTSGDVTVGDLRADRVKVGLTSGDLSLRQSGSAELVEVSCTSGDVTAALGEVGKLTVRGTSGNIQATLDRAKEAVIATTSGNVSLAGGGADKVEIGNTSGGISVSLEAFDDLKIDSTSGNVVASLPSEPGYRADIDTASGSFDHTVALARDGDAYVCGDGSARVRIDTTSGNILLNAVGE